MGLDLDQSYDSGAETKTYTFALYVRFRREQLFGFLSEGGLEWLSMLYLNTLLL